LPGRSAKYFRAKTRRVVARCHHRHHLDRAASQAECHWPERILARPVQRAVERRSDDAVTELAALLVRAREQVRRLAYFKSIQVGHGSIIPRGAPASVESLHAYAALGCLTRRAGGFAPAGGKALGLRARAQPVHRYLPTQKCV
jgi:hypothetical protein